MAFGLGLAAALGLPPFGLWPLTVLALAGLYLLVVERETSPGGAALAFWVFGLGYHALGMSWIAEPFFIDPATIWLFPFALVLMPAGLALFFGAAGFLARLIAPGRSGLALTLTALLFLAEFARGFVFTGLPWNLPGSILIDTALAGWASVIGVYGLTLAVIGAGFGLGALAHAQTRVGFYAAGLAGALVLVAALWPRAAPLQDTQLLVRLVQPDNPQASKADPGHARRLWARLLSLSAEPRADGQRPALIVWPEGVTPFLLDEQPDALQAIREFLPPGGHLIVGSVRRESGDGAARYFNTLFAVDASGVITARYDKAHLVPFGEYLPWPDLFRSLGIPILAARADEGFTPGPGLATLSLPRLPPFAPLICYEAIFPAAIIADGPRPAFIINITDDSWFGLYTGPYQHLAAVRFRAIEEGLPVLRVATTGITALIDADGRLRTQIGLGEAAFRDVLLPQAKAPGFFAQYGHSPILLLAMLLLGAGVAAARLRRDETIG